MKNIWSKFDTSHIKSCAQNVDEKDLKVNEFSIKSLHNMMFQQNMYRYTSIFTN